MTVRRAADVAERPVVELIRWRIMKTAAGTHHLIGCETLSFTGRVSSAVESFNLQTREVRTHSGRVYELNGPPGFHPAADYVWARWCQLNHVSKFADVTRSFIGNADIGEPEL